MIYFKMWWYILIPDNRVKTNFILRNLAVASFILHVNKVVYAYWWRIFTLHISNPSLWSWRISGLLLCFGSNTGRKSYSSLKIKMMNQFYIVSCLHCLEKHTCTGTITALLIPAAAYYRRKPDRVSGENKKTTSRKSLTTCSTCMLFLSKCILRPIKTGLCTYLPILSCPK
jgi:hypothetical protein